MLRENYDLFGKPEEGKTLDIKAAPTMNVRNIALGKSVSQAAYLEAVDSLNQKAQTYYKSQKQLATKVNDVKKVSEEGQSSIQELIGKLNYQVSTITPLDSEKDVNSGFVDLTLAAFNDLIGTVEDGTDQNVDNAASIRDMADQMLKNDAADRKALLDAVDQRLGNLNVGSGTGGDGSGLNLGADNGLENLGKDTTIDPNTGLPTDNTSTADNAKSKIDDAIQQIKDSAMTPNSSMASPVESPSLGSGLGGMMDPMGMGGMGMNPYMNPYGMGMGMDPYGSLGDSLRNRADDLDPNRIDRAVQPLGQAQPQQPAPSTPWSNQNNAAPVSNAAGGPPPNATSSQPGGTTPPPRVPGSDGMIEYAFPPDFQRKQKVSPVVAQALDAAFANTKGTDAKAAYSGTTAKWSDNKQVGARIDPSQLMTGDVALWDKDHAAIVVAFGSGDPSTAAAANFTGAASFTGVSGGSGDPSAGSGDTSAGSGDGSDALQVIVCGELKRFDAHMSDVGGDFGDFSGFAHPAGIEGTGAAHGDAMPAVPAPGDPSAGGPTMSALAGTQTI
ncbi:hypothetical protein ACGF5S_13480 [Nocardia nova]|uniref:hypothetical protein n=1 Tax=Nocardia nova TaxID=37330 RepID=UPI003723EE38